MGSVGPSGLMTPELDRRIRTEIVNPLSRSMEQQGLGLRGYAYLGGKYDPETDQLFNIEWNMRNGGSEAGVNIAGLKINYFEMIKQVAREDYSQPLVVEQDGKYRVSVAGVSLGYPDDYSGVLGRKVHGLEKVIKREEVLVLGAAIEDGLIVSGGRIFWMVGEDNSLQGAIDKVYRNMDRVWIPGDRKGENLLHFRKDIGEKEKNRLAA